MSFFDNIINMLLGGGSNGFDKVPAESVSITNIGTGQSVDKYLNILREEMEHVYGKNNINAEQMLQAFAVIKPAAILIRHPDSVYRAHARELLLRTQVSQLPGTSDAGTAAEILSVLLFAGPQFDPKTEEPDPHNVWGAAIIHTLNALYALLGDDIKQLPTGITSEELLDLYSAMMTSPATEAEGRAVYNVVLTPLTRPRASAIIATSYATPASETSASAPERLNLSRLAFSVN